MNSFGRKFILTTFGESHGPAIGGVIDGCPPNLAIDFDFVRDELSLRSPASVTGGTGRREPDDIEFLSGIFEGKTLGTPIAYIIRNRDCRSADYLPIEHTYRPGHADYTYDMRYGIRDYRGGGRASARETVARVVAGAIAQQWLKQRGISVYAFVDQIGSVSVPYPYTHYDLTQASKSPLRTLDAEAEERMREEILCAATANDSIGGAVTCVIKGVPAGIGNPVFDKIQAALACAMMSIPAAKSFEYGLGVKAACAHGTESNDEMRAEEGSQVFTSNNAGGAIGGITTGQDIYTRIAFKPVASIGSTQNTVTDRGEETTITIQGRHDVCVAPRAAAVVKAMAALTITDHLLIQQTQTTK